MLNPYNIPDRAGKQQNQVFPFYLIMKSTTVFIQYGPVTLYLHEFNQTGKAAVTDILMTYLKTIAKLDGERPDPHGILIRVPWSFLPWSFNLRRNIRYFYGYNGRAVLCWIALFLVPFLKLGIDDSILLTESNY